MNESNIVQEYNYASLNLKAYQGEMDHSSKLLKELISLLKEEEYKGKVIDRFEKRNNTLKRELVIVSNKFGNDGRRCFGKIALIKNRNPFLWQKATNLIEEIQKEENKKFIEISNYVIHFDNAGDPIIMFEFNHEGPRLSDFEYYLRQIARTARIAKQVNCVLHIKTDFEKLDKEITNVFGVTVKVDSGSTNYVTNWFKSLKEIREDSGYKDVRLEFFYKRVKNQQNEYEKNIRGLDFARNIISWLKRDRNNIEHLDDLKMSYQINGTDEIIDMDFIKNKQVSIIKISTPDGTYSSQEYKELVGGEFNRYLQTGKTNQE